VTVPEFSRPVRVDTLGPEPRMLKIEAEAAERQALARRFDLVGIDRLTAQAALVRKAADIVASGRVTARVTQTCVASGEPVDADIDAALEIVFRPQPGDLKGEEEIELSGSELDVVFYDGAAIDLGEAAAETLFLSLDPYPRSAEAAAALEAAGVKSEEEAGPFGALAALRDRMKKE